jgi:RimJ/RimL family protein N-acetyltransferase
MNLEKLVLKTRRLRLVPINLDFKGVILNNFTSEITKYMYPQPTGEISDTIKFIVTGMEGLKHGTNLQLVIVSKKKKEFVGCVGLHNLLSKQPEIGIWVKKEAHGNAYGLEAVNRIIKWAKKNLEYDYLKYPVDRNNGSSRRIPEFNKGIIMKEYKEKNEKGDVLDIVEYWIKK